MQRRLLVVVSAMDVGSPAEHLMRRGSVALLGRHVEGSDVVTVRLVQQLVVVA